MHFRSSKVCSESMCWQGFSSTWAARGGQRAPLAALATPHLHLRAVCSGPSQDSGGQYTAAPLEATRKVHQKLQRQLATRESPGQK